ncbi:MAG: class I SAM-dependent methyltransferase [Phycisphaerales bacterium]
MTNNMTHDPKKPDSAPTDIKPAFIYAKTRDWSGYFQAVEGREPRETVIKAIDLFAQEPIQSLTQSPRMAVDLGCGEGRDSAALLRAGWRVHAIDGHPEGLQRLIGRSDLDDPTRLTMQLAPFESVEPPSCDLLNASFSLPFCHPDCFDKLWEKIVAAIRPGGRFSGQLFGDRDSWASIPDRSHHTKSQVERLLEPFEIEQMKEDERKGEDCGGTKKDWHVFHIVARKPTDG